MIVADTRPAGPSSAFLAIGALIAAFYVAAQIFQRAVFAFILPDAPDAAAEIASRLLAPDRARQVVVLASLFLVPVAYLALASARWDRAPGAVFVGIVFGVLFSALESAYRSIDLFVVGGWAAEFVAADTVLREALLDRFELWDAVVAALYLPLLAAHALASTAFAVAVGAADGKADWWDRALVIALAANAIRGSLRILQMHGGFAELDSLNSALYLPVTLLTYCMVSAWLARAAVKCRRPR